MYAADQARGHELSAALPLGKTLNKVSGLILEASGGLTCSPLSFPFQQTDDPRQIGQEMIPSNWPCAFNLIIS